MFLQPHVSRHDGCENECSFIPLSHFVCSNYSGCCMFVFCFLPFGLYYTVKSRKKRAKREEGGENRVQEMVWGQAVAAPIMGLV